MPTPQLVQAQSFQDNRGPVEHGVSAAPEASSSPNLQQIWQAMQPELLNQLGTADHAAWVAPLAPHTFTSGTLTLVAPSPFMAEYLQRNYVPTLQAALAGQGVTGAKVVVHSGASVASSVAAKPAPVAKVAPAAESTPATPAIQLGSPLDARYTFQTFVTGKGNQFAFSAAQRVAAEGASAYNPFFLHGGVGLGKTHLMHAIGHAVKAGNPAANILYLTAEQFFYQFIKALKDRAMIGFKDLFRNVDVLLIDDVQFIFGKDATQEEFFHTFNALMQSGKQIILTADKSPHELANVEERLKSRLGSGLTIEVHAPDGETRHAILQKKAESLGYPVSPEVIGLLATHIASNVRELEGALNRLVAYSRLTGEPLTPDLARSQLADLFRVFNRTITLEDIQKVVADVFNVRVSDMHSPRRSREVARPRQVAMYLAKQLTNKSYPDIGRAFGGRDHTTVIHACEQVNILIPRDPTLAERLQQAQRTLTGR
jgi:chromosomal replication initiator protein